jgi:hypothetical protein
MVVVWALFISMKIVEAETSRPTGSSKYASEQSSPPVPEESVQSGVALGSVKLKKI